MEQVKISSDTITKTIKNFKEMKIFEVAHVIHFFNKYSVDEKIASIDIVKRNEELENNLFPIAEKTLIEKNKNKTIENFVIFRNLLFFLGEEVSNDLINTIIDFKNYLEKEERKLFQDIVLSALYYYGSSLYEYLYKLNNLTLEMITIEDFKYLLFFEDKLNGDLAKLFNVSKSDIMNYRFKLNLSPNNKNNLLYSEIKNEIDNILKLPPLK